MRSTRPESNQYKLEKIRRKYNLIGKVYCPCLKADVIFNAQGFHHFKYHGNGKPRIIKDLFYRLKLFIFVIPIIKNSQQITEYKKVKETEYWSFVARVGKNRSIPIKIILKRRGNSNIIFWSVMRVRK